MKEKYLFVGGKADGHMIDVPSHYGHWEVPVINDDLLYPVEEGYDIYNVTFKKEIYRKIVWRSGDDVDFKFFALESLSNKKVMGMVLDNYKPKQDVELDNRVKSMRIMLERSSKILESSLQWIYDTKHCRIIWDFILEITRFLNKN